jgi:hypothetical protein
MLIIEQAAGASIIGTQEGGFTHGEVPSDDTEVGTEDLEADDHQDELDVAKEGALCQIDGNSDCWVEHTS